MLINIRVSALISDTSNSIPLSILSVIAVYVPISETLPNNKNTHDNKESNQDSVDYVSSYN